METEMECVDCGYQGETYEFEYNECLDAARPE